MHINNSPQNIPLVKLDTNITLPKWISGKLVRNGPALFEYKEVILRHWFDGYGMLHGFLFKEGEVFYQSKYIESKEYLNAKNTGKVGTVTWGTAADPCRSIFRRFIANFSAIPDNTNVNVINIGSKYYTTSDIATINEFDIETLDTLSNLTTTKSGVMAAHPSYTTDGILWNMISNFGPFAKNTILSINDKNKQLEHYNFKTDKTFYFHSFANTDRYFIIIEQPLYLNFWKLILSGIKNLSFYECFSWNKKAKNIFHIYDRVEKKYTSFKSNLNFFFFHTINSFQVGNNLYIDICAYDDSAIISDFYKDSLANKGIDDRHKATLRRITIDLSKNNAAIENFEVNFELPNINSDVLNKKHQYIYGIHSPKGNTYLSPQIIKIDMDTKKSIIWQEDNLIAGEPIFIPNPHETDEDAGVVVVLCHNKNNTLSELVVLNAKNLGKIATYKLPQSIPPALHGWFYPSSSLH